MHAEPITTLDADVVVIGGGAAGVATALSAAEAGARTLLVERGTAVGGELVGGLPILGVANARGEWIVGGPFWTLVTRCEELGGYAGRPFDGRTMYGACIDPEVMRLVVVEALAAAGVQTLVGGATLDTVTTGRRVDGVLVHAKSGVILVRGRCFVDASGDADFVVLAGGETVKGAADGTLQPVSLTFRMSHVDFPTLLAWIGDHPEELTLAENPILTKSAAECARGIRDSGLPFFVIDGESELTILGSAIDAGSMFPTTAIWAWPTSLGRQELGFNTTRIAGIDATDLLATSNVAAGLGAQVLQALAFLTDNIPGFAGAHLSGVAPKVGVRETRRIIGEVMLDTEGVIAGAKRPDGIARGGHHVDIHGAGKEQTRVPIANGGSYDIPYGALVPVGLDNVLVAGRCLASTREANGSARVMGTCLATGQAAGIAAARAPAGRVRDVDIHDLRTRITAAGGIVEGPA